ncbi:hypothetical protein Vadar_020554 [Vaccinium darrowii]|uniref:Uncharacterized protein n=1 Tax=Vaccinium darrowii TaxID=229202 RepID=A0ACB7Y0M3_9ERIC|nr:hypothetical protein Vadar_020554 [Vaccinium darrowii]
MDPNQPGRLVQFLVGKARREECLSESYNESLAKTFDLNLPAANLSSFGNHPAKMKIGFIDEVQAACHVHGTKKRSISGFTENPGGHMENSSFILQSSSKSIPPTPEYLQYRNKSLFGHDGQEDPPSLVCMGCVHCYMYVMVSKNASQCPKCKSINLLDILSSSDQVKKQVTESAARTVEEDDDMDRRGNDKNSKKTTTNRLVDDNANQGSKDADKDVKENVECSKVILLGYSSEHDGVEFEDGKIAFTQYYGQSGQPEMRGDSCCCQVKCSGASEVWVIAVVAAMLWFCSC